MSKERVPYWEKLKDPRWQKKRLELFEAAGFACSCCGDKSSELQVHHKLYLRNTDPWAYEDWAYAVLCAECHQFEQELMEAAHAQLAKHPFLIMVLNNPFLDMNDLRQFTKIVDNCFYRGFLSGNETTEERKN